MVPCGELDLEETMDVLQDRLGGDDLRVALWPYCVLQRLFIM